MCVWSSHFAAFEEFSCETKKENFKGVCVRMSSHTAPDDRECASGTEMAGKASACEGCPNASACASGASAKGPDPDVAAVNERMSSVRHKVLVLSGKGGVGKSTFASLLARAMAQEEEEGKNDEDVQVGLMDIDICGPSAPRMLGLMGRDIHRTAAGLKREKKKKVFFRLIAFLTFFFVQGWEPVFVSSNLGVMSVGFMLESEDTAVIWRGPKKNGLIKQFLRDVEWGTLDYLIVDTPPGTSDEHLSISQYLSVSGAVIVTTPQEVSLLDVRKEISFCRKMKIPVIGVVENMSGFVCPGCKNESQIFKPTTGGAKQMCLDLDVPYIGAVPIDPRLARACDEGKNFLELFPDSPATKSILECVKHVKEFCKK